MLSEIGQGHDTDFQVIREWRLVAGLKVPKYLPFASMKTQPAALLPLAKASSPNEPRAKAT